MAVAAQPGVSSKSPRRIATGSPSTTVQTPSPSTTKRNAVWVWRWTGAFSRGPRYWIAAQRVGGRVRATREARVGQGDGPPLAAAPDRHQVAGALGEREQPVAPAPQVRYGPGRGVARHQVADLGPERDEAFGREAAVELVELGGRLGLPRVGRRRQRVRVVAHRSTLSAFCTAQVAFSGVKKTPPYAIASVDHALKLATMLAQEGPLRVTDAAELLGVSGSTAHRLLSMLVYRDFAEQRPDRRYGPGPVLAASSGRSDAPIALLRRVGLEPMRRLVEETDESTNLSVLVGDRSHFVATVESRQVLRVGDRAGRSLPAHLTSGGKAILATWEPARARELFAGDDGVDPAALTRELSRVRRRGYAVNDQATETGLTALGVAIRGADATAVAAVSLAVPSARFHRDRVAGWLAPLTATAAAIEHAVATG